MTPTTWPAWGYRRGTDGEIIAELFPDGRPEGWADTPARVDELNGGDAAPVRKRGRPRKVRDGDGQ